MPASNCRRRGGCISIRRRTKVVRIFICGPDHFRPTIELQKSTANQRFGHYRGSFRRFVAVGRNDFSHRSSVLFIPTSAFAILHRTVSFSLLMKLYQIRRFIVTTWTFTSATAKFLLRLLSNGEIDTAFVNIFEIKHDNLFI